MTPDWDDNQPIYRQLAQQVESNILDGALKEGEAIPSVRTVAAEMQLNPITVSRAYQLLADDGLLEKRRGRGMFVREGARQQLIHLQQARFMQQEWPRVLQRIQQLELDPEALIQQLQSLSGKPASS